MATKTKKKGTKQEAPKAAKAAAWDNGALLDAARELLPRLQSGSSTLSAERDKLGLKNNGPLRKALTELLGGKKQYQEMMKAAQAARPDKAKAEASNASRKKGTKKTTKKAKA